MATSTIAPQSDREHVRFDFVHQGKRRRVSVAREAIMDAARYAGLAHLAVADMETYVRNRIVVFKAAAVRKLRKLGNDASLILLHTDEVNRWPLVAAH